MDAGKKTTASSSATTASPGSTVAPPTRTGTFQSTPICVAGRGSKPTASTGNPAILLPPFRILSVDVQPYPSPEVVRAVVGDGYFAVSTTKLYASPNRNKDVQATADWLKGLQPVDRTGTFLIYRFR